MLDEASEETRKPRQHRSPSYPAIDLRTALERTEQLWRHAQRHYVPVADAMRTWGYSPKSSGGLQTIGALNRFELIDDQGKGSSRQIRVSDLGREIVTDEPDSSKRLARIQEAALKPKIHAELWSKYEADLPPDATMKWDLVNVHGFSEGAARELIHELRSTAEFARLAESDDILSLQVQEPEETTTSIAATSTVGGSARPAAPQRASSLPGVQLPLGPGKWASLQGPFPLDDAEWQLMLSVLQAMKPGLVASEASQAVEESDGSEDDGDE